ncbi:hypothetical protein cypCar_00027767 [Cyprinus carpio]|nr:hypothetical protein cypCar_00027767 [Cyprinus carpio]
MALDFVAGCMGGAAGVLVGHPFDTVKRGLMGKTSFSSETAGAERGKPCTAARTTCFQSIVRQESRNAMRMLAADRSDQFLAGAAADSSSA